MTVFGFLITLGSIFLGLALIFTVIELLPERWTRLDEILFGKGVEKDARK